MVTVEEALLVSTLPSKRPLSFHFTGSHSHQRISVCLGVCGWVCVCVCVWSKYKLKSMKKCWLTVCVCVCVRERHNLHYVATVVCSALMVAVMLLPLVLKPVVCVNMTPQQHIHPPTTPNMFIFRGCVTVSRTTWPSLCTSVTYARPVLHSRRWVELSWQNYFVRLSKTLWTSLL